MPTYHKRIVLTPSRNSVLSVRSLRPSSSSASSLYSDNKRLDAGAGVSELSSLLQVNPIDPRLYGHNSSETKVTKTEVQFVPPPKPACPAPPCPYNYWWAPQPAKSKQGRLKQQMELEKPYINIMADRRVIRGPNFLPAFLLNDIDPFDKAASLRREKALRKIADQHKCKARNMRNVIGTVPAVLGREHLEIQTEKYLEELVARPPALSIDTQTDLFLERPPIPPYKPAKVGVDCATEIGDGELFHFDAEAQPIIDVLVDGTLEQSILEIAHEQELGALREKQEQFLVKREAELAELRRLEAEEIRLQAEKERRLRQDKIAKELDMEMQRAVVAAKLLQGHISSLLPEIWSNIEPASDAAKKDYLLKTLCPWLSDGVELETKHIVNSRNILNSIFEEIVKERATIYGGYKEEVPSICYEKLDEEEGELEGFQEGCSCDVTSTEDDCPVV